MATSHSELAKGTAQRTALAQQLERENSSGGAERCESESANPIVAGRITLTVTTRYAKECQPMQRRARVLPVGLEPTTY